MRKFRRERFACGTVEIPLSKSGLRETGHVYEILDMPGVTLQPR